jgi:hypothetical protein
MTVRDLNSSVQLCFKNGKDIVLGSGQREGEGEVHGQCEARAAQDPPREERWIPLARRGRRAGYPGPGT